MGQSLRLVNPTSLTGVWAEWFATISPSRPPPGTSSLFRERVATYSTQHHELTGD
jgi:hypothetical protein